MNSLPPSQNLPSSPLVCSEGMWQTLLISFAQQRAGLDANTKPDCSVLLPLNVFKWNVFAPQQFRPPFLPGCCFGWPRSLGNTGHRNPVQLFNSFSLLADTEFIYRENIQKCASRLMWGMEQHPQEAQIHKLWSLSIRRCYCRMWGVSGIVNSMKKSPRGDLFTGSGSSNRRSLALLHSVVFICRNPCCRMLCMLKVYMNRKKKKNKQTRQTYGRVKKG